RSNTDHHIEVAIHTTSKESSVWTYIFSPAFLNLNNPFSQQRLALIPWPFAATDEVAGSRGQPPVILYGGSKAMVTVTRRYLWITLSASEIVSSSPALLPLRLSSAVASVELCGGKPAFAGEGGVSLALTHPPLLRGCVGGKISW
ncbi:hypothetical protein CRG98_043261, partial [Punica granatum]